MKTNSFTSQIQKYMLVVVMALTMFFGMLSMAPEAKAQVDREAMMQQIEQLLQMVLVLQTQLAQIDGTSSSQAEGGFTSRGISIGDQVQTTDILRVRAGAGLNQNWVNNVSALTKGAVKDGPRSADGYTWWYINYDSGTSGWSVENWLQKTAEAKPGAAASVSLSAPYSIEADKPATLKVEIENLGWDPTYRYLIHFGDGSSTIVGRQSDVTAYDAWQHIYNEPGIYEVSVTYTDWGSTDPNNDVYGVQAMRDVNHARNTIVAQKTIEVFATNETNYSYDLEIIRPRSGVEYEAGDKFRLEWEHENLENERGIVTLEGNNKQRHILQNVDLSKEYIWVEIPERDELGEVTAGSYDLSLWVSYIKDGDPKGESDSIRITIENDDELQSEVERLTKLIDDLNSQTNDDTDENDDEIQILTEMIEDLTDQADDNEANAMEDELQSEVERLTKLIDDLNSQTNDDTDENDDEIQILMEMIEDLTDQADDNEANAMEDELQSEIEDLVNLVNQLSNDSSGGDGGGESDNSTGDQNTSFWDFDINDFVYVVGAYKGSYPDGDRHSFGYHPQGEVILNMNRQAGQSLDTMLVLTSYESVHWKLQGDATDYVTRVFLSGYYDQEISGIGNDVEVIHLSHESGDSQYFYAYDEDSSNFGRLQDYILDQSGKEVYLYYQSGYSLDSVNLGQKG